MAGKLKVYGVNTHLTGTQRRTIACVTSQGQFAKLCRVPVSYIQTYGTVTGNEEEIKIAKSDIGAVFIECGECRHYHKFEPKP